MLAGAKYLDMIWYRVDTCKAINSKVNNIKIPNTEEAWIEESNLYQEYMIRKHGGVGIGLWNGVVGAGNTFYSNTHHNYQLYCKRKRWLRCKDFSQP